jgi:hypothetical protein
MAAASKGEKTVKYDKKITQKYPTVVIANVNPIKMFLLRFW